MKKISANNVFKVFPIVISIGALICSIFSYNISKQSFEYNVNKDMFTNTPAIQETIDSSTVIFSLNNEHSILQTIKIVFPQDICNEELQVISKPAVISKMRLESCVKDYLQDILDVKEKDSIVVVGNYSIPVMITYSVVIFGFPYTLRENRLLVFEIIYDGIKEKVDFKTSFLIDRCGYPLKKHYFYTGIFATPLEEKVAIQDAKDVQIILKQELASINNINKH